MQKKNREPKNQHTVSQVYLRYFAYEKNKNKSTITVFDKIEKKCLILNIASVASKKNFYTVEGIEDKLYWEKYYSEKIESRIPQIYNRFFAACKLAGKEKTVLSDSLKKELAEIIISQALRTPKYRELFNSLTKLYSEELFDEVLNSTPEVYSREKNLISKERLDRIKNLILIEDFNKNFGLNFANEDERIKLFIKLLMGRYWIVYKNLNYKIFPFVTSDIPVAFYNRVNNSTSFTDNGIAKSETIIFFPVNPEYLIGLYPDTYFIRLSDQRNKCIETDDNKFIFNMNKIQDDNCIRQIYSNSLFAEDTL